MNTYTANQLQALVNAAYLRGYEDGKLRRDDNPRPPHLYELLNHSPKGGIVNLASTNGARHADTSDR